VAILKKIVLALVVLIVLLAAVGMLLPRNVHVERSIVIDAPAATVFALLDGYKQFNKWSPWAVYDPNAKHVRGQNSASAQAELVRSRRGEPAAGRSSRSSRTA
jgi:hypothetical protein